MADSVRWIEVFTVHDRPHIELWSAGQMRYEYRNSVLKGQSGCQVVLAVTLVVVALAAARRMAVTVVLDDERLRVQGEGRTQSADWSDVVKVTRATGRITLHRRNGSRVALVLPRGGAGDLNALGVDIARRLDANRGYQS